MDNIDLECELPQGIQFALPVINRPAAQQSVMSICIGMS